MWRVALRDLQWRRRRFVIAVLATSLVFGMTLLMTGFSGSLHNEGPRIVAAVGADAWLVADGAPGPFTTSTPIRPPRRSGSPPSPASCGPTRW
jgi:putative ABC transport system permease protein